VSDFSDFKTQIAEWANRQDWSDTLVTSFVRMAEQKLNAELRIDLMIQNDEALVIDRCAQLPDDWLQMDLVRLGLTWPTSSPPVPYWGPADGFLPVHYKARDEFFREPDSCTWRYYTIEGRQIFFGGTPDQVNGKTYKIAYYGEVPAFNDDVDSWVYTKFPNLYLFSALMHADLHAIGEEPTAGALKQLAEDMIGKLNQNHLRAKASGSRVNRSRRRSFG
jgi:hypothetical protein